MSKPARRGAAPPRPASARPASTAPQVARRRQAELDVDIGQAEIGIEQQHPPAGPGQRVRQRDGEPGLADAALAGGDGDDAAARCDSGRCGARLVMREVRQRQQACGQPAGVEAAPARRRRPGPMPASVSASARRPPRPARRRAGGRRSRRVAISSVAPGVGDRRRPGRPPRPGRGRPAAPATVAASAAAARARSSSRLRRRRTGRSPGVSISTGAPSWRRASARPSATGWRRRRRSRPSSRVKAASCSAAPARLAVGGDDHRRARRPSPAASPAARRSASCRRRAGRPAAAAAAPGRAAAARSASAAASGVDAAGRSRRSAAGGTPCQSSAAAARGIGQRRAVPARRLAPGSSAGGDLDAVGDAARRQDQRVRAELGPHRAIASAMRRARGTASAASR